MHWPFPINRWFEPKPQPGAPRPVDTLGETLHAVVSEHARVKADCIKSYDVRVQSMIDELFLRMEEGHARHDP